MSDYNNQQPQQPQPQQPQQPYYQQPQQPYYQQPQQPYYQQPQQPQYVQQNSYIQIPQQQVQPQPKPRRRNGAGTAGFVFALLDLFLFWVPILDIIFWFLSFLLSFIGLFKRPKGLAIVGFIFSFIDAALVTLFYVVGLPAFIELLEDLF